MMQEHAGHRDRLRQRVQQEGLLGLKPHEVIEFLLYYCIPRQNVNEMAHALIRRFGTVQGVLSADAADLMQVSGVGSATANWLSAVGKCALCASVIDVDDCEVHQSFSDTYAHICAISSQFTPPCTVLLCYDMDFRLVYERELCASRMWGESSVLMDILGDVFSLRAQNAVLVEFVGDIDPKPGNYDTRHAQEITYTLHTAGCDLVDFIIFSNKGVYSMYRNGDLPTYTARNAGAFLREAYRQSIPDSFQHADASQQ